MLFYSYYTAWNNLFLQKSFAVMREASGEMDSLPITIHALYVVTLRKLLVKVVRSVKTASPSTLYRSPTVHSAPLLVPPGLSWLVVRL